MRDSTVSQSSSQIETKMNTPSINWFVTLSAALTLGFAGSLTAQEPDEDEIFELSPFTIDASEDTGYTATATLAGTRVRTNLKDLGAAISVYTEEFMNDTAATDAASLLSYTSNIEVGRLPRKLFRSGTRPEQRWPFHAEG